MFFKVEASFLCMLVPETHLPIVPFFFFQDLPIGTDMEMIEALLAHMQNQQAGGGGAHMYDDIQDDDDDDDYDEDEEDDDEEDYYAGGGDQINLNMYQNPYAGGGAGGGGGDATDQMLQGLQGLQGLQSLLGMSTGAAEMGSMAGGMGGPLDGAGGFDVASFLPNNMANMGAAIAGAFSAANGLMDGLQGHPGGGATLQDYDEDDDEEEELTEGSETDDEEEDEESDEDDDDKRDIANMAMMGGLAAAAGGGMAAVAAMMNGGGSSQPAMYGSPRGPHMMVHPHGSPYMSMGQQIPPSNPAMMAAATSAGPSTISSHPNALMSNITAAASVAAAAAALSSAAASPAMPMPIPPPASVAAPATTTPTAAPASVAPPMSISNGFGGGTVSRVDPLAALAMGSAAAAAGGAVIGKVVSSNNSGGGTALVKPADHFSRPVPANKPPTIHKSMDELNKLSDSLGMTRLAPSTMAAMSVQSLAPQQQQFMSPHSHAALSQQHPMFRGGNMVMPRMGPMPGQMMPGHPGAMSAVTANNNDGDKTSLDRESVPGSDGSGGGKSDTESTSKKTPSPSLVGPGRVSPDSSSSSGSSSSGHVKNATSFASLSDLPSATESMRDSDTDHNALAEQHQQQHLHHLQRHLQQLELDPSGRGGNGFLLGGPVPLLMETPGYGWSSLVGHENAKESLKNMFTGKKFPEVFDAQGSCRGVLLFGPSGAGKTSLARSLAYEAGGAKLIACSPNFVMNRPMHPQSAATLIRQMFDHARVHKPCVMLMDEIELLAHPELNEAGKWAKNELMAQVRGETTLQPGYPETSRNTINDHVMLVATTCSPWVLPDELRRLFAYNIHIKLPGEKQREELFRMFLNNSANNVTSDQYKCIISKSEG